MKDRISFLLKKPAIVGFLAILLLASIATAGSLTPPGAVSSTMHSLADIWNSIASNSYDSTAVTANQNGSLIQHLKYIEANLSSGGVSSNSLDFDELVNSMTLDANTNIASAGFALTTSANVGIGTTTPGAKLALAGGSFLQTVTTAPTVIGTVASSSLNVFVGVYVQGKYAYTASYTAGRIDVIDVSVPSAPVIVGTASTGLSGARGIYVAGKYAYVASLVNNQLVIFDISNPGAPTFVSTVTTGAQPVSVYVSGKYAYLSTQGSQLVTVDISKPLVPTVVSTLTSTSWGSLDSVYVTGKYAYVVGRTGNRFSIVDVSNPTGPVIVSTINDAVNLNGARWVTVSGRYAYVTGINGSSLAVIDVSHPAAPVIVGTVIDATRLAGANEVAVAGRYAYVTANTGRLTVVDISIPSAPTVVASRLDSTNLPGATALFVAGKYVYTGGVGATGPFAVVDISGMDAPSASIGDIFSSFIHVSENLDVNNNLLIGNGLNVGPGGIMSNGPMSILGTLTVTGSASQDYFSILKSGNVGVGTLAPTAKFSVVGDRTNANIVSIASSSVTRTLNYLTIASAGHTLIDGQAANPIWVSETRGATPGTTLSGACGIAVQGKYAYVGTNIRDSLAIIDISNPSSPSFVSEIQGPTPGTSLNSSCEVAVSGRYVYMTSLGNPVNNGALSVIDVSNPKSPVYVSETRPGPARLGQPTKLVVQGKYAYIADQVNDSLVVVDISNPASPSWITMTQGGAIQGPLDAIRGLAISGRYIYAANAGRDSMAVIDISNPASPSYVAETRPGGPNGFLDGAQDIAISGRYAYIPNITRDSLAVIDISNPASPSYITETRPGGSNGFLNGAGGVFLSGRYAYVANNTRGSLAVVDISNPASPSYVAETRGPVPGTSIQTAIHAYVSGRYAYVTAYTRAALVAIDVGSLTAPQIEAGTIRTENLGVVGAATFGNSIFANGGLIVGEGLLVNGTLAVAGSTSTFTGRLTFKGASASGNFDPATDNTYNLGDTANRWKSLFLGPGSLHMSSTTGIVGSTADYNDAVLSYSGTALSLTALPVGSGASASIEFRTGTNKNIFLSNAGNVGIGTTSPATKLEVRGSSVAGVQSLLRLTHGGTTANDNVALEFLAAGGVLTVPAKITGVAPGNSDQELAFTTVNNGFSREKMRINDSGSIGIGTTAPTRTLDIFGSSSFDPFSVSSSSLSSLFIIKKSGNVGIGTTTTPNKLTVTGSASFSGNVGIGTTTPSVKLDVRGLSTAGEQSLLRLTHGGSGNNDNAALEFIGAGGVLTVPAKIIGVAPGGFDQELAFTTVNNGFSREKLRINDSGNVGIGTTLPTRTLDIFGSSSFDPFSVASSSLSNLFIIKKSGNVGIGTTTPNEKLDVNGAIEFNIASSSGVADSFALCHNVNGNSSNQELLDCGSLPVADYMEMYPTDTTTSLGDIVMPSDTTVGTTNNQGNVPVLVKATDRSRIIGIISDKSQAGDFNSIGYNIPENHNPQPLALNGRVKMKFSAENGPIAIGDPVTLSTLPGIGAKATTSGMVIGTALQATSENGVILVFVKPTYWAPSVEVSSQSANGDETSLFGRIIAYLADVVLQVRGLIADTVTSKHGVTTYDEDTGLPFCIKVKSGQMVSVSGACSAVSPTPSSTPAVTDIPSPTPDTTPEPTPTPTDTPAPEPTP